jgi:hypothetical protein
MPFQNALTLLDVEANRQQSAVGASWAFEASFGGSRYHCIFPQNSNQWVFKVQTEWHIGLQIIQSTDLETFIDESYAV